jgi:WD40 repeat protein
MSEIFKYQWLQVFPLLSLYNHHSQGDLSRITRDELITASFLEENALLYGTSNGFICVFTLAGKLIKKYKAHEGKVNSMCVDNTGSTIFSCSANGTVVSCSMKSEVDEKETLLSSSHSLQVICIEDSLSTKKERSFIVGIFPPHSGTLIDTAMDRNFLRTIDLSSTLLVHKRY